MQGGYWIGKQHIFLGDVPYHYYISAQGEVAQGRELKFTAFSNTIYKTPVATHITMVLEGNFENEAPTQQQLTVRIFSLVWRRKIASRLTTFATTSRWPKHPARVKI